MKRLQYFITSLSFSLMIVFTACVSQGAKVDQKLWYHEPSNVWEEALPLGNGRLGAMVFGNPTDELFQLNDNTLWSGYPKESNNPKALTALAEIRKAIFEEDYTKATDLWKRNAQGPYTARYLPMANLHVKMPNLGEVRNFYRDLNISKAISTVSFEANGIKYKRTSFISYPDQVMVVRFEADKDKSLNFDVGLTSKLNYATETKANDLLVLKGKAPSYVAHRKSEAAQIVYDENGEGMDFEVHLKLRTDAGELLSHDSILTVKDANAVTLILSAATSFNGFDKSPGHEGKNTNEIASVQLQKATNKGYKKLLKDHLTDYQSLFDRVEFNLGNIDPKKEAIPTNERLKTFQNDDSDNGLVTLYYQFNRYLTIACSRIGGVPSNLQGLWNEHVQPPWGSNYTTNINTEMNYWGAEPTGLQECHIPLLDFIGKLAINGAKTARINYGIEEGWVAHHNSDLWAQTAPSGNFNQDLENSNPAWSCWPMAGVWFSKHLWDHYMYGGDTDYLKTKAYPLMRGAAQFALAWLQEDNNTPYLVTIPSSSPENRFKYVDKEHKNQTAGITKATTMDMALIWDLFTNCMQAANTLNVDGDFVEKLKYAREKLYPHHIGPKGQLLEWHTDFEEPEPHHRHLSHLFGLYPGNYINPRSTPELANAAKQSLLLRGDGGGVGWSTAWKIGLWARLEDGNTAYENLKNGLNYVDASNEISMKGGGSLANLFNTHPPFQIDGNFGGLGGITEMLLQCHRDELFVLPALPDKWPDGEIKGIRAKGGFILDLVWKNGALVQVSVHSILGGNCRIRSFSKLSSSSGFTIKEAKGSNPNPFYPQVDTPKFELYENGILLNEIKVKETNCIDFETKPGETYILKPAR